MEEYTLTYIRDDIKMVATVTNIDFLPGSIDIEVVIPDSINSGDKNYTVTGIGYRAFRDCSQMSSITIPSTVITSDTFAFFGCTNLKKVYITNIESWLNIDFKYSHSSPCYNGAELYLINAQSPIEDIVIPKNITEIKQYAFSNCTSIKSVEIGDNVTTIGRYAFLNCPILESVKIGKGTTNIESYAFWKCSKLLGVLIGSQVETIGESSFRDCSVLENITIPSSVKKIGTYAFGNSGLKNVSFQNKSLWLYLPNEEAANVELAEVTCGVCLPKNFLENKGAAANYLTSICSNYPLRRFENPVDISILKYSEIKEGDEVVGYSIDGIEVEKDIIYIPDSYDKLPVVEIKEKAFQGKNAKSIIIAANISKIGYKAFAQNTELTQIILNEGLQIFGEEVFYSNSALKSLFFPSTITTIGNQLISWCSGLEQIFVNDRNKYFSSKAIIEEKEIETNCLLNKDKTRLIYGCRTSIIPKSVTTIGQGAFYGQKYKKDDFKIPNNVIEIETLGIGFQDVKNIYLPQSLEIIRNNAFYNCIGLENIYYNVKNAKLMGEDSPVEHSPFCLSREMTPPRGVNIYIGGSVEAIPPYMFKCNKHTGETINFRINSINIGWGIEEIADNVFGDMVEPREVLLPSSVTKIGANSFSKDVVLKQDKKYAQDFVGFTYNGYHSIRDLNIYRTSNGSRYDENLTATMTDKTADVPGGDGQYYFGTQFKNRTFNISYAFDALSESGLTKLKEVFRGDGVHDLIFDETPYKVWSAKVTGTAQIKHICFEENGERRYKGEGSITFTCYYPFAHTPQIESQISPESVHMMAINKWIPTNMLIQKNGQIKNLLKVSIEIKYNPQIGDSWGKEETKEIRFYDQIESYTISSTYKVLITAIKLTPTEGQVIAENSIKVLPTDGVTMDCPFSYTSRGCFEHLPAQGGGRDINSYSIYDYPNKKEWVLSTNMITTPYDNLVQNKGAINYGQLPAPFKLKMGEITFSEDEVKINEVSPLYGKKLTNQTLQIGDNVITITSTPTTYHNFVWDSKTGIVKAEDSLGNNIYLSYTGNSIGTIPPNTSGVTIFFPNNAKLEYDYWYY